MKKKKNPTLLLVDDEKDFLISTAKALQRRGFTVTTVQNGSVALRKLEDEIVDLAILDVKMPGIPGDQLFFEVKKRWPHIPVILLTGHGNIQQAFETSREGVFEYLTKPCNIEKLVETINRAIDSRSQACKSSIEEGNHCDIRLLIVDDEKDLLDSLSVALLRRGMRVFTAQDGKQALDILDNRTVDVALLDVKMPKVDGIDLLQCIKQMRSEIEVLLLTGHPSTETVVRGLQKGAFDYLLKPQDMEQLVEKIYQAYKRGRVRAEKEKQRTINKIRERYQD